MLLAGILLGLVLGLVAGGRLGNLADVRIRWLGLLFGAVAVRFVTEWALVRSIPGVEALRVPLHAWDSPAGRELARIYDTLYDRLLDEVNHGTG